MKFKALLIILTINILNSNAQTLKRGLAYGHNSPQDLSVMAPDINWWYNWSVVPEATVASVYGTYGFEFVPMTWNGSFDETALRQFLALHTDVKYLLAFNEPNFIQQANMTPSAVAAQWTRLESIANDYNLKIVGPAVNFCGTCVQENGVTYTDPIKYLDDFFTSCPNCKVDYIAIHCYMNTVSALQWYVGLFKKYGKPIWLTEFAGWEQNGNVNNLDDQINFMIGAVDMLETDPGVFRYSWFIGRGSGIYAYPYIDLLGSNGKLTALGQVYKSMPVHNENKVVDIPGVIEAEAYNKMSGILIQKTSDNLGFANVGYIESGDWLEYKINVPSTSEYDIYFRAATTKNSSLTVQIDGANNITQSFTNTNGWQNWSTFKNKITLTQGVHTLKIMANTDGFNLNWFQIGGDPLGLKSMNSNDRDFKVYPNPSGGIIHIQTTEMAEQFFLFQPDGKQVACLPFSNQLNLSTYPSGNYLLHAVGKDGRIIFSKWVLLSK